MDTFIITYFYNNKTLGFLNREDVFTEIVDLGENKLGNIYNGIISEKNINLSAVFVEFDNTKGFLKLSKDQFDKYKCGDKILVQVEAEPKGKKLYSLSSKLTLKGKYVILVSGEKFVNISKKIDNLDRREQIKSLAPDVCDVGFLFRTESEQANDEDIKKEAVDLLEQYNDIVSKKDFISAKECLYREDGILKYIKGLPQNTKVVTDMQSVATNLSENGIDVTFYDNKNVSIQNKYRLGRCINEATDEKVWLKSGAYLVIQTTEALTSIDVNSGKNVSKNEVDKNHFLINKEAAIEVVRQLKLRNISGIVIVDFINMKRAYQDELFVFLNKLSRKDRLLSVVGFTKLGLMEISRKKERKSLKEILEYV